MFSHTLMWGNSAYDSEATLGGRHTGDVLAIQMDSTCGGGEETSDAVERRRLARPRWSEQCQTFAAMHGEIALLEGGGGSELDADVTQLHRSLTDGRVGRGRGASRHGAVRFFSQPGEMGDSAHWSVTFL